MSVINRRLTAKSASDGDGVSLKRVFGYHEKEVFDPFLLLDHIDTTYPQNGFPWHPHRGIETISYCVHGEAYHEDSLGNKGTLHDGDIQWMKTGNGILHQEIPGKDSPRFEFLQLWLNMPASKKMIDPEYFYMNVANENIIKNGTSTASIIAGSYQDTLGAVQEEERKIRLLYFDIDKENPFTINRVKNTNAFIYILGGDGFVNNEPLESFNVYQLREKELTLKANSNMKLLFAEGTPLNEPIEWYGPIVMNTKEEIRQARTELQNGTFTK